MPEAPGPSPIPAPPRADSRRRRWVPVLAIVLALLVVLVVVADRINLNYFAISPGDAQSVGPLITVPASKNLGARDGNRILLTDVFESQVTLLNLVPNWLSSNTTLISSDEVLAPGTTSQDLATEGFLEMAQSQTDAKAAALRRLGYSVSTENVGALVDTALPGSPGGRALSVGQVITAVNGAATSTACSLIAALHPIDPGQQITLSVQPVAINDIGAVHYLPAHPVRVRLARFPRGLSTLSSCPGVQGPAHGFLGVSVEDQQAFGYPFPVSVNTAGIGGPSAGLAMTLGIIEKLSGDRLTGHQVVAATGTIDADGNVGDVGGVAQKTVAVERAGATVFLVPPQELAAARSKDVPSLHIYAVSTLNQALAILSKLGGQVPPLHRT